MTVKTQQYKFTDIDVRNNDELVDVAYEYLEQYSGEFEFLISCKMRVQQNVDLSIGMVRGVLNCMRVDPRVKLVIEDDEVVNMVLQKSSGRYTVRPMPAFPPLKPVSEYHPPKKTEATLNVPYMNASNSFIYHESEEAYFVWFDSGPVLKVRSICATTLKDPFLLNADMLASVKVVNGEEEALRMCRRCAKLQKVEDA